MLGSAMRTLNPSVPSGVPKQDSGPLGVPKTRFWTPKGADMYQGA